MRNDYVTQLLTGRTDDKGKFIPFKVNPYPLMGEVLKNSDRTTHEVMAREDLWPPQLELKKYLLVKSKAEKEQLAKAKKEHKKLMSKKGFDPKKRLNVSDPMTIIL